MGTQTTILRVLKRGLDPYVISSGPGGTSVPPAPFRDTFDRVELYTPGSAAPSFVIDALRAAGMPDPDRDTFAAVDVDGSLAYSAQ